MHNGNSIRQQKIHIYSILIILCKSCIPTFWSTRSQSKDETVYSVYEGMSIVEEGYIELGGIGKYEGFCERGVCWFVLGLR